MKAALMATARRPAVLTRARVADFVELTKPRIAVMALLTVAVGYLLAAAPAVNPAYLVHTLIGTALVAGGASAFNQLMERHSDAQMRRTANRPIPSGRLQPEEAFAFAASMSVVGIAYLAMALPHAGAAIVAAVTLASYVGIYTPLKQVTPLNTLVGAVPGALPPVIGWCAAGGSVDAGALALFLIVFLWQLPHFLAIAWIYRADYAAGGHRMLPLGDVPGRLTARTMLVTCLALIPVSVAPYMLGLAGPVFAAGSLLLGIWFLSASLGFVRRRSDRQARVVLRASLLYLPGVLALLVVDGVLPRFFG
jgi:heme o synthase